VNDGCSEAHVLVFEGDHSDLEVPLPFLESEAVWILGSELDILIAIVYYFAAYL